MTTSRPVSAILSHSDPVAQMIGVLVGDRDVGFEAVDQLVREGDVVALSGRADQTHRIANRVAGGVDLGAQAFARPAKALRMRPASRYRLETDSDSVNTPRMSVRSGRFGFGAFWVPFAQISYRPIRSTRQVAYGRVRVPNSLAAKTHKFRHWIDESDRIKSMKCSA
jgi:hypothetical protein